ncbi:MAG TPA: hypothetical protein VMU62_01105 [Acidobacteriaceae bacterium]|nr:hypothetical protein [Acidobacteriaceae bacterium]
MILPPAPDSGISLILIEGSLTGIAIGFAFAFPKLGSNLFLHIERAFGRLARRKGLSVAVVGLSAFVLRLAILPLSPVPQPFVHDDFSFLLAADTFASGRLTNPTPAMWVHFETFHETMKPTYMSMYFPAQGLVLAAGKVLTGHPWYGLLVINALMCAAICWMLHAWLPPTWALLGGILAILRLCLFSYWTNTYSGGGCIAALAGALVLGGLPQFMKTSRRRDGLLMSVEIILLAISRPYEGVLLCLPVMVLLARWMFIGKNRPTPMLLLRRIALPLALIVAAGAWMGYYNHRAFGNSLTPPYSVDRATYAMAPYFIWQSARPEPVYRHAVMRDFYYDYELKDFYRMRRPAEFLPRTLLKAARGILFYAGIVLLIPLIMVRRVFLDRRIRFLVLCVLVLMAGQLVEIYLIPHYLAVFTAAFYAIGLQAMRHLRVWWPESQPVGMQLVRLTVAICVLLAGVRLAAEPLHLDLPVWPAKWAFAWFGSSRQAGTARARVEAALEQQPGGQLVLVHYSSDCNPIDEWVYNAADIDHSKVIWAWDMGAAQNRELIDYYKGRKVWLVQPDTQPATVSPYSVAEQQAAPIAEHQRMLSSMAQEHTHEVIR